LPPLLLASAQSQVQLIGGTHNPGAPPFDFLQHTYLPIINRMGPQVQATLERPGFAPAGGGCWDVTIRPVKKLKPIELLERGAILRQRCQATITGLPRHIAERELASAGEVLDWPAECFEVEELPPEYGPGNIFKVSVESEYISQVFTSFGQRGVRAERVGQDAAEQARRYLAANVPVGDCLADQLLLPMALAGSGRYKTLAPTRHAQTNMEIIRLFLGVQFSRTELSESQWLFAVT
jgi:RNA 3'-terminal phosphate cyclase (ATP)